jgi:hypothetical protein
VLSEADRKKLMQACIHFLSQPEKNCNVLERIRKLDDHVAFYELLRLPENHIKVASGRYVEKTVYVRPVHDITDEMAQELMKLPRFTAYVKISEEADGEQIVSIYKVLKNR